MFLINEIITVKELIAGLLADLEAAQ